MSSHSLLKSTILFRFKMEGVQQFYRSVLMYQVWKTKLIIYIWKGHFSKEQFILHLNLNVKKWTLLTLNKSVLWKWLEKSRRFNVILIRLFASCLHKVLLTNRIFIISSLNECSTIMDSLWAIIGFCHAFIAKGKLEILHSLLVEGAWAWGETALQNSLSESNNTPEQCTKQTDLCNVLILKKYLHKKTDSQSDSFLGVCDWHIATHDGDKCWLVGWPLGEQTLESPRPQRIHHTVLLFVVSCYLSPCVMFLGSHTCEVPRGNSKYDFRMKCLHESQIRFLVCAAFRKHSLPPCGGRADLPAYLLGRIQGKYMPNVFFIFTESVVLTDLLACAGIYD